MKMQREKIKAAMLERMEELGINVATLARKAGVSYDTPRDFLVRDKSIMPAADKLVAMLAALDLQHLLAPPRTAGASGFSDSASRGWKGQAQTLGKKGNAKSQTFTDGSGWEARHDAFLPGVPHEFLGKTCVVKLGDARTMLRRVTAGSIPGHYVLEPVHPGGRAIKDALVVESALVTSLSQK